MYSEQNSAVGFSILTDETADITSTEQMSLGFVLLMAIVFQKTSLVLSLLFREMHRLCHCQQMHKVRSRHGQDKLLGQGYDGCSVMASIQNGVQARIREKYLKAAFVHQPLSIARLTDLTLLSMT